MVTEIRICKIKNTFTKCKEPGNFYISTITCHNGQFKKTYEQQIAVDSEKVLKHVDKDNTLKSRINKGDTIY